ncbi:hypothetical protein QAD02_019687 [Eretmocerus hayati]|uniref:Uncharacterized protein n=1 Tax=Eretmocerus hayati TaxID=131215 RepID=A0ACC2PQ40_9HYME|nr:hypothetical protein QAD02_019687 [Eretmocerus hayati]
MTKDFPNTMDLEQDSNVDGDSPLHTAVKHQNLEMVELIIKHGNSIHAKNRMNQTPLHLAYHIVKTSYPSKNISDIMNAMLAHLGKPNINAIDDSGLSYFHIACEMGCVELINHYLDFGVNINAQICSKLYSSGYTPLHLSIQSRHKKVVETLLNRGANLTIRNDAGDTPIHLAFLHLHSDEILLNSILAKCSMRNDNALNKYGLSHLHVACAAGNVDLVKDLLNSGASLEHAVNLDSPKCAGYTSLHFAVEFNRERVVKLLLEHGAETNVKEKQGLTALHLACQQTARKIHTVLRNAVSISGQDDETNFDEAYKKAPSSFLESIASQTQQEDIIGLLLQFKSDVNAIDILKRSPLFHACDVDHDTFKCNFVKNQTSQSLCYILNEFYLKRTRIIEKILSSNLDVNIIDTNGQTALHFLTEMNKPFGDDKRSEVAELLLRKGANVNIRSKSGSTPLHIALKKGHFNLIEMFLKYNADPNITDQESCTALHLAASNDLLAPNFHEIINSLLAKGADVDAKQTDGKSALHLAASTRCSTSRLTPLLSADCDINCQDNRGKTALHMACVNRNADNVKSLLNHGADINIVDRYHKTAFYYFYEYQMDVLDSQENVASGRYLFNEIYYIFRDHIRKLREIGFHVNWDNISYFMKLKELNKKFAAERSRGETLVKYEDEIRNLKKLKISSFSSLYDIIFKDLNEMTIYVQNPNLKNILSSKDFKNEFPNYGAMIECQFKKGMARCEILQPAKDSLNFLTGLKLPDPCSERILKYLNNKNLKDIIKAQLYCL